MTDHLPAPLDSNWLALLAQGWQIEFDACVPWNAGRLVVLLWRPA